MPARKKKTTLKLPILALRGLMVFPHMVLNFDVGRQKSVGALEESMMEDQRIFLVAQRDAEVDEPTVENLCSVGTVALIRQVMNLPGDAIRVLALTRLFDKLTVFGRYFTLEGFSEKFSAWTGCGRI